MDSLRLLENPAESKVKISDLLISTEKNIVKILITN